MYGNKGCGPGGGGNFRHLRTLGNSIMYKGKYFGQMRPPRGVGKNKAKSKKQGRNKAFLLFRTKNREEIRKWVGENIKIDGQNIYPWWIFRTFTKSASDSVEFPVILQNYWIIYIYGNIYIDYHFSKTK